MRIKYVLIGVVVGVLFSAGVVLAGSLNPTAGPTDAASQMYTLEQIYTRLTSSGNATKMTTFTEPAAGPGTGTMHTLDDIYNLAWPARVSKTGQTSGYVTGDDGNLQKGVAWPNPRFTDNGNGTVTDNLTGLIWLKHASCWGNPGPNWATALSNVNNLANGQCGLSDGSTAGQWRLPNVNELQSLLNRKYTNPPLPNTAGTGQWTAGDPFTNVYYLQYWTSSSYSSQYAFTVSMFDATLPLLKKDQTAGITWAVRGGQ